jgi:4-hydroxy-tetrahydrodipicolinate reductase
MGSIMTRLLIEQGASLVGAVGRSPLKVGRDLGEVAELGVELGVIVEDDPSAVLERAAADVAVVAVSSYLETMYDHFRTCLEHGCNVVTIEEESFFPWSTAPALARRLDELGKRHGVTIMGSGAQDLYWMTLPCALMGAAHQVDSVHGRTTWNVDDYGPEVALHVHAGSTVEEFESTACTQVINRIPDVINAPPGFVTVSELPRLRYRHFPLQSYLQPAR